MYEETLTEVLQLEALSENYTVRANALEQEVAAAQSRLAGLNQELTSFKGAELLILQAELLYLQAGIQLIQGQADELRRRASRATIGAWRAAANYYEVATHAP